MVPKVCLGLSASTKIFFFQKISHVRTLVNEINNILKISYGLWSLKVHKVSENFHIMNYVAIIVQEKFAIKFQLCIYLL